MTNKQTTTKTQAIELSQAEIAIWSPATQAVAILMDAHFAVFNAMEATPRKIARKRMLKALGTIQRAAGQIQTEVN